MIKSILKKAIIPLLIIFFIYKWFFYINVFNGCYIKIIPSAFFEFNNGNIKEAIKVLKNADFEEYKTVCRNVKTIDGNPACGGFNGGCYYISSLNTSEKRRISVSTANSAYLAWTAAVIVHETCHAVQAKEGRGLDENECYTKGGEVLESLTRY
jgi:hypothetical protein